MSRPAEHWPRATTRLAAVIGKPVRHSLSPVLHNAAFAALDLDWAFVAFEVPEGGAAAALDGAWVLGIDGLSVTMPHKAAVAEALDGLSPTAKALGAVNTVVRAGSELLGENTDGQGFLDALRQDEGFDPAGRRCLVLGSGGAAKAVVHALARASAGEVVVSGRTAASVHATARLAGRASRVAAVGADLEAAVAEADLVVNATPVGMQGETDLPLGIEPSLLHQGQLVADLVYEPAFTPLLAAARSCGAVAVNGVGMLIHQAAHAFRLWTGEDAPLEVMSAAALRALARPAPAGPGRRPS